MRAPGAAKFLNLPSPVVFLVTFSNHSFLSCALFIPHVYFLYSLFPNRALSFQVTMSHQGTLHRCGLHWKIKQAIPATAEHRLPPTTGFLIRLPGMKSLLSVGSNLPSVKIIPPAGQVLPIKILKMPHADIHNLIMGDQNNAQSRRNLLQFLVFLLRAPAISFHLIHSQGLSEQSAAVMVTGSAMLLSEVSTRYGPLPTGFWTSAPVGLPDPGQLPGHHQKHKNWLKFQARLMSLIPLPDPNKLEKQKRLPRKPNHKPLNSALLKLKLIFYASETTSEKLGLT